MISAKHLRLGAKKTADTSSNVPSISKVDVFQFPRISKMGQGGLVRAERPPLGRKRNLHVYKNTSTVLKSK